MFNKMIAQQTAKKEKLLDNFLKKHEAEYPFPEDVELICDIDYMGDGKPCHFMDIYRPRNYEGKLPVMFNLRQETLLESGSGLFSLHKDAIAIYS